jgi:hypothetical protein
VAKDQINALVKSLDKLGLGTNEVVHELQSTRSDTLLTSVILVPLCRIPHRIVPSTLEQVKNKLQDVSDRAENVGYMGSDDFKVVSELVDEIRAVIIDCKVSGETQTGSVI